MAEKELKKDMKKAVKKASKKAVGKTYELLAGESEDVDAFMLKLKHPLKAEIEAVRSVILSSDKKIKERVKWAAPSFFYINDIVTFNPRDPKTVHLVFHHPEIEQIKSHLFEGNYVNRRMIYLRNMAEVKAAGAGIKKIMKALMKLEKK